VKSSPVAANPVPVQTRHEHPDVVKKQQSASTAKKNEEKDAAMGEVTFVSALIILFSKTMNCASKNVSFHEILSIAFCLCLLLLYQLLNDSHVTILWFL
jgi:hypothetical protein